MKIIVEYEKSTGYITDKEGAMYLIGANIALVGFENENEINKNMETKLSIKDIIDLKRADVI